MKKKITMGRLEHCRLVTGTCPCYRDIRVKGTGDGSVREGLQCQDILWTSSPKAKLSWGVPYCHF